MADEDPRAQASAGRAMDRFLVQAGTLDEIKRRNEAKLVGSNKPSQDELDEQLAAEESYNAAKGTVPGRDAV